MEKLISANKFSRDIIELAEDHKFDYHDLHFSTLDMLSNIDCQPAVEAVPISYICSVIKKAAGPEKEALIKLLNEFEASKKRENDIQCLS